MGSNWQTELVSKPKLRTYIKFKDAIYPEPYVLRINSRLKRSLLAQLRIGILPIRVETGRFRGLTVEERVCEMCNLGKIENEINFICECPLYDAMRANLFEATLAVNPNFLTLNLENKFIFLMKNMWR